MSKIEWCHVGGGKISDSDGNHVGEFYGDFRQRDRLICAVNGEAELQSRIVELETQLAERAALSDLEIPARLIELLNSGDMEALLYRAGEEEELRLDLYRRRQNIATTARTPAVDETADFDAWSKNPYTLVLRKSIADDYVPRNEAKANSKESNSIIPPLAEAKLELLRAREQLAESKREYGTDVSRLIATVKYLVGIAERGENRKARDDETAEGFVLGYVKKLECELFTRPQEVQSVPDGLIDLLKSIRPIIRLPGNSLRGGCQPNKSL